MSAKQISFLETDDDDVSLEDMQEAAMVMIDDLENFLIDGMIDVMNVNLGTFVLAWYNWLTDVLHFRRAQDTIEAFNLMELAYNKILMDS